jgi:DNA-binding NarL/FixJ family response regulator
MGLHLQVIARNPIVAHVLTQVLSSDPGLAPLLSNPPIEHFDDLIGRNQPHLFVFDGWYLHDQLTELTRLLRVRCPGSKFLSLAPAEVCDNAEMLRLLYAGIDGVVRVEGNWQEEILLAIRGILGGNLWFPRPVVAEYVRNTNLLLDKRLRRDLSLTARETEVLELMIRRFSNKEIAGALHISERTVKFHVSNVLLKLSAENRRSLLTALDAADENAKE